MIISLYWNKICQKYIIKHIMSIHYSKWLPIIAFFLVNSHGYFGLETRDNMKCVTSYTRLWYPQGLSAWFAARTSSSRSLSGFRFDQRVQTVPIPARVVPHMQQYCIHTCFVELPRPPVALEERKTLPEPLAVFLECAVLNSCWIGYHKIARIRSCRSGGEW